MECVFVGHSYIRRLRDHYLLRRFRYRDVRPHHVERACELARELELDNQFAGVYTAANDIVFIHELEHTRRTIATVKPGVVVIDIGTNDIARLTADDHVAILNLVTRVYEFARSLHVSLVVVNAVIPRCKGLSCSPDVFMTNAKRYNSILKTLVENSDNPAIVVNKMRGFFGDGFSKNALPVLRWSSDGIHANNAESIKHYRNRTRHCVLENLYRFVSL